jgi:hypothetical protein
MVDQSGRLGKGQNDRCRATWIAAVYQRMYRYRRGLYSAEHFQRLASRRAERAAPPRIEYVFL